MKNSARMTNNASNIRYFLRYLSVTLTLKFSYESIFKITKNRFLCFCFFYKLFGDKRF
jgi:hypothetical protein